MVDGILIKVELSNKCRMDSQSAIISKMTWGLSRERRLKSGGDVAERWEQDREMSDETWVHATESKQCGRVRQQLISTTPMQGRETVSK